MGVGAAASGAAGGAAKGAMFGPWGAAIGGGLGLLGGILGGRAQKRDAEARARNQNRMNRWRHKFEGGAWQAEKQPYYRGRDRSRSLRNQLVAALMGNPKYGLAKLFPGFAQFSQRWTGGQPEGTDLTPRQHTASPYDVAGAPPEMEAVGQGSMLAQGLGGAMSGASAGIEAEKAIRGG